MVGRPVVFIGVDVQVRRPCAYAVIDRRGRSLEAGWLCKGSRTQIARNLRELVIRYSKANRHRVAVGIDAPRVPLRTGRRWQWHRSRGWRLVTARRLTGRHCETIVSAHRLANPQWTPLARDAGVWMRLGFRLFSELRKVAIVHEVFPSASYWMLRDDRSLKICIDFREFHAGPKDMLDAYLAAVTVREFVEGRGEAVGGGDGLGAIVLPRPISENRRDVAFSWPTSDR